MNRLKTLRSKDEIDTTDNMRVVYDRSTVFWRTNFYRTFLFDLFVTCMQRSHTFRSNSFSSLIESNFCHFYARPRNTKILAPYKYSTKAMP